MVKVGVIGCGRIAQERHLPEYNENPNAEIAAVYDLNEQRARETAAAYHTKACGSLEDMLEDPSIDAVSICVANVFHCEMTVKALRAGKHVLCEKPMAVTLDECRRMVSEAQKAGKFLMIGHNQRFAKAHVKAKELIEKGEIGKILTFRTTFGHGRPETWTIDAKNNWFFDKKKAIFGAMADLGIHKTDLIQFLTGKKIKSVTARMGTLDKKDSSGNFIGVDDNTICIYQLEDNILGTMTASWTYYGPEDNSTIIYGTEGIMRIYDDPDYSLVIEKRDGTSAFYKVDQIQTNEHQTKSGIIDSWIESLEKNRKPEISGDDVLEAMKAVFAAADSAREGKTILLQEENE